MSEKPGVPAIENWNNVAITPDDRELLGRLEKMSLAEKAKVTEVIRKDGRLEKSLKRTGSIAAAAWDGWEKGVNGSLEGIWKSLKWAGEFIGESAAIAVNGEEGALLNHSIAKTEWIRKGLNATGEFIGVSAAIIAEKGAKSTAADTRTYWESGVKKAGKLTAEQIAHGVGNVAGSVAVGMVAGAGLNAASKSSVLGHEISLGKSTIGKLSDQTITKGAKVGAEYVGVNTSGINQGAKAEQENLVRARNKNKPAANDSQYKRVQEQKFQATGTDGISVERTVNTPRSNVTELPNSATQQEAKIRKNARLGDAERLQASEDALRTKGHLADKEGLKKAGLMDEQGRLTQKAHELILDGHHTGKPVFEQDFASIRAKAEASRGLPKEWKKELMDQGLMGTERAVVKPGTLAELKKIDTVLANRIESFLDPNRKIKFPHGSMGGDMAKTALDSTLIPLREAATKLSPELYEQIKNQVYESVEKQLVNYISFRTNWNIVWVESNKIKECFEKLAKEGFPMRLEAFAEQKLSPRIGTEFDKLLSRSKDSGAGVRAPENVKKVLEDLSKEMTDINSKIRTPKPTKETLDAFDLSIKEKLADLTKKIEELKILEKKLVDIPNRSLQEWDARMKVGSCITKLEDEIKRLKYSSDTEVYSAKRRMDTAVQEAKKLVVETEPAKVTPESSKGVLGGEQKGKMDSYNAMTSKNLLGNSAFKNLSPTEKANVLLANGERSMINDKKFDLSADNLDRFFYGILPELDDVVKSQFTPEVMAKFGRDASGNITQDGVRHYGSRALNRGDISTLVWN